MRSASPSRPRQIPLPFPPALPVTQSASYAARNRVAAELLRAEPQRARGCTGLLVWARFWLARRMAHV